MRVWKQVRNKKGKLLWQSEKATAQVGDIVRIDHPTVLDRDGNWYELFEQEGDTIIVLGHGKLYSPITRK